MYMHIYSSILSGLATIIAFTVSKTVLFECKTIKKKNKLVLSTAFTISIVCLYRQYIWIIKAM